MRPFRSRIWAALVAALLLLGLVQSLALADDPVANGDFWPEDPPPVLVP